MDLVGRTIGRYLILQRIGAGGMGAVYLAQHEDILRKAAIKVLNPEIAARGDMLQRFFNEARAAALARHPSIIDIYEYGQSEFGAYLIMEYLEGETLAGRLRRGTVFTVARTASLLSRVAAALEVAHARGIVHRDLKPDNIFLTPDPDHAGEERVKILDFGIAKLAAVYGGDHTATGMLMGTPEYMSPEQCDGSKRVDHRTDVYAVGVIAFKMMCGRAPFVAEGKGTVLALHLTQPAPRVRSLRPEIAIEVDEVIDRALRKDPDRRWPSMAEFGRAFRVAAGLDSDSVASRLPPPIASVLPPVRPGVATETTPQRPTPRLDADSGFTPVLSTPRASTPMLPTPFAPTSDERPREASTVPVASTLPTMTAQIDATSLSLASTASEAVSTSRIPRRSPLAWVGGGVAVVALGATAWFFSVSGGGVPGDDGDDGDARGAAAPEEVRPAPSRTPAPTPAGSAALVPAGPPSGSLDEGGPIPAAGSGGAAETRPSAATAAVAAAAKREPRPPKKGRVDVPKKIAPSTARYKPPMPE